MVYLIHLSEKIAHAQHYIGFAETPATFHRRIEHHRKGTGAKLLAVAIERGISFDVVRTWDDGDRNFERQLKNQKKSRCLCPVCKKN